MPSPRSASPRSAANSFGDRVSSFLAPDAVAVIGASNEPTKRGYRAVQTLLKDGFAGRFIRFIRATEIQGCSPIPISRAFRPIDLALVCTAAATFRTSSSNAAGKASKARSCSRWASARRS